MNGQSAIMFELLVLLHPYYIGFKKYYLKYISFACMNDNFQTLFVYWTYVQYWNLLELERSELNLVVLILFSEGKSANQAGNLCHFIDGNVHD